MSTLGDTRDGLAALLKAGLTGFEGYGHLPGRITPPLVAVIPGSPYLERGDTVGSFRIRLEAHLVVGATNNETSTAALDTAIEDAAVAAVNGGWTVTQVLEPYALEANAATLLAAPLIVTKTIRL